MFGSCTDPQHTPLGHVGVFTHPIWNGLAQAPRSVQTPRRPVEQHVWPCGQSSARNGSQGLTLDASITLASGVEPLSGIGPGLLEEDAHPIATAMPRYIPTETMSFAPFMTLRPPGHRPSVA